jgi:type IV pilus assembly protein pilP
LIVLTELVEDSSGNWIYRKAELPLSNNAENSSNDASNASATNSN